MWSSITNEEEVVMSNLLKIKEMAASVNQSLADLNNNPSSLDDVKKISNERRSLQDQLAELELAEAAERDRLLTIESAKKLKRRKELLLGVAEKSQAAMKMHADLTEKATSIINELVSIIIERENVFNKSDCGLNNTDLNELITTHEHSSLIYDMQRSALGIYPGDFSATFEKAVIEKCAGNKNLKRALLDLVKPSSQHHKPLSGANSILSEAAKSMAEESSESVESEFVITRQVKHVGNHYQADLRQPGAVLDLNAQ